MHCWARPHRDGQKDWAGLGRGLGREDRDRGLGREDSGRGLGLRGWVEGWAKMNGGRGLNREDVVERQRGVGREELGSHAGYAVKRVGQGGGHELIPFP